LDKIFEYIGRKAGKAYKKGKWFYNSLLGDEEDAIKAEFSIGYEMARDIASQNDLVRDQLVKNIGAKIRGSISTKHRFNFYTIKSKEVNAFALPGGFVFLTDAILSSCNRDEDEIAFIVCHEMAHVIRGHAMERILAEYSINTIAGLVKTTGMLQNAARRLVTKYLVSSYSRDNEFEADLLGTKLMIKSGYNSNGAVKLLQKLKTSDTESLPYFSSHPEAEVRINNVKKYITEISSNN
jgi:predicted Zn-dependent protease